MNKSESIAKLSGALSKAQSEMPAAELNATNPFLKNKYADLGSIIKAAKPVLGKHGLSVAQSTTSNNGDIGVTTLLIHESGEWLEDTVYLPLGDEKGKSQAQVAGSIVSYLRRYSLASMLCIYADEDTDGETGKGEKPKAENKPVAQQKPEKSNGDKTQSRPYPPEKVREGIMLKAKSHKPFNPTEKQRNLLRYGLELCFAGDENAEDKRHTVLNYLLGSASTKDVDGQHFRAIIEDWLKLAQDDGGEYAVDSMACKEAEAIYRESLKVEGQHELAL